METILLLFLALTEKDENMKRSLRKFLDFYQENRELLQTLAGILSHADGKGNGSLQQESRPRNEVGDPNVLEEYLRRVNA